MAAPWGAGALHQRLNAFVKKSLIQQLVPPNAVVCDLYCGRGVDTENWGEAKIGKYVGVDLSSSALEEAKEEWERNEKPFVARFCELNPCMVDLEKHLGVDRLSVDVVTCLSHLQDCFANEDMVRQLLKNVASLLKPGGFFFGATPDSSTIWYKYQKAVEGAMKAGSLRANGHLPRVRTELYSISFEDDRFNEYGSRYQLRFADESVPPQSQILVHFPSLIRRAEELGLECVEIQNLTEFYEDYRVPFAESLQKSCGTLVDAKGHPVVDGKSRLSPVAQDVLSLYTTFIFKKPDPQQREKALKRPPVDAKKSKKFSPAVPEDRTPLKKQRLSASPAVVITSNGSKMPEPTPMKQEKVKTVPKPDPVVATARSAPLKPSKPSTEPEKARTSVERMQQKTESPSVSKAKRTESPKPKPPEVVKVETSQLVSKITVPKPSEVVKVEGSQLVSKITVQKPSEVVKVEGSQLVSKITVPKPSEVVKVEGSQLVSKITVQKPSEVVKVEDSQLVSKITVQKPSEVVKVEGSQLVSKITVQGTDTTNKPPESKAAPEPVKRKRVSRWSSEYVPKATISAQNLTGSQPSEQEKKDQVSRFGSSQATSASYNHQPVPKPLEPPEEGEVGADDPVRERHAPHNATSSETVPGERNAGSDAPDPQFDVGVHPKPRKKEIAMDVFQDHRQSTGAAFELASSDMDFERGSKLSRDCPADASSSDRFGSWETKPQRYTLRRAASLSEGGVESSPWSRGGGEGRPPYQLRAPGAAPGLLGVAPVFADRGESRQRFEGFTRPSLRGNMYKHERVGGAPGDGGNGAPWEDNHFQGDPRSRVNR